MGENHRMVPLALIKFSIFENFKSKIIIYIEISQKIKYLLKFSISISKLFMVRKFYNSKRNLLYFVLLLLLFYF